MYGSHPNLEKSIASNRVLRSPYAVHTSCGNQAHGKSRSELILPSRVNSGWKTVNVSDENGHCIALKCSVHWEDKKNLSSMGTSKYDMTSKDEKQNTGKLCAGIDKPPQP